MKYLGLLKGTKFSPEPSPSVSHRPDTGDYLPFCCDFSISFFLVLTLKIYFGVGNFGLFTKAQLSGFQTLSRGEADWVGLGPPKFNSMKACCFVHLSSQ